MKNWKSAFTFAAGTVFGICLALCIAASDNAAESKTQPKNWSHLQLIGFSAGMGVFDPSTGTLYMYDSNLENCFGIRKLTTLGAPMTRLRN